VSERYAIPDFFREGYARLHGSTLGTPLVSPKTALRTTPLGVDHPSWARHEIEVHLAKTPRHLPPETSRTTPALVFERKVQADLGVVTIVFELHTRADAVSVEDVATHLRNVDEIRDLSHPSIHVRSPDHEISWTAVGWSVAGVFSFASLLVGFAYVPSWWRRRSWRSAQAFGRGDTAKTARRVKSREEAERDVLSRRCTCGVKVAAPLPQSAWSSIELGDTTISVVRAPCECGIGIRRYYVVPSPE